MSDRTNLDANAQAAEFVRDAYEKAQNDHRVHARRSEEFLSENPELVSEVAEHWQKQVEHSTEAMSELEAVGDALSRLKRGVVATLGESFWEDVIGRIYHFHTVGYFQWEADRLIQSCDAIRARRVKSAKSSKSRIDGFPPYAYRKAATEASLLAYHAVMSAVDANVAHDVVTILSGLLKAEGKERRRLAWSLTRTLYDYEDALEEV